MGGFSLHRYSQKCSDNQGIHVNVVNSHCCAWDCSTYCSAGSQMPLKCLGEIWYRNTQKIFNPKSIVLDTSVNISEDICAFMSALVPTTVTSFLMVFLSMENQNSQLFTGIQNQSINSLPTSHPFQSLDQNPSCLSSPSLSFPSLLPFPLQSTLVDDGSVLLPGCSQNLDQPPYFFVFNALTFSKLNFFFLSYDNESINSCFPPILEVTCSL